MPEEQITIGINEIAELIRNKYGYKSVSIDRIWTGIRCDDMQYVELGPGSILNVHISVSGKRTKDTIMVITRPAVGLSIEITNPQPVSVENDNISDADYALRILHEQSTKQINAAMGAINEADWPIEDGMEILCEINHQGFTYPESINILKEVMFVTDPSKKLFSMGKPQTDSYIRLWGLILENIIGKRRECIQQYERQKIFENALHYGLEITKDIRKKEVEKEKKINVININNEVRVNLTAHGQEILRQFYLGSYGYESLISSHYVTGNTYDFQMWELMKIFGKHMDNGMKTIFEKNKINVKGIIEAIDKL